MTLVRRSRAAGIRRGLALVARSAVLLAASYVLVATSPLERPSWFRRQICTHPPEQLRFDVSGSCGSQGTITISSGLDDCAISVQGTLGTGLPSGGRFFDQSLAVDGGPAADAGAAASVSLQTTSWVLSGYLGEPPADGSGAVDAGDGGLDGRPETGTPNRRVVSRRTRSCHADPSANGPTVLTCRDEGTTQTCTAELRPR